MLIEKLSSNVKYLCRDRRQNKLCRVSAERRLSIAKGMTSGVGKVQMPLYYEEIFSQIINI